MNKNDNIKIFFCTDENYSKLTAVAIASLAENTKSKCDIFVLDIPGSDISDESKGKILDLAKRYDHISISCQSLDTKSVFNNVKLNRHVTLDGFSRMLIPREFPEIDRAIYLDPDLIVVGDIAELWNQPLNDYALAAVERLGLEDVMLNKYKNAIDLSPSHRYFNSGVLLMDCKKWRDMDLLAGLIQTEKDTAGKRVLNDQCVLNKFFENNYMQLNSRFNEVSTLCKNWPFNHWPKDVVIRHFSGIKPWKVNRHIARLAFDFWKYAAKTEFFEDFMTEFMKNVTDTAMLAKKADKRAKKEDKMKKLLKKFLVNVLCIFIPKRKNRKKLRRKLLGIVPNKPSNPTIIYLTGNEYNGYIVEEFFSRTGKLPNEDLHTLNEKIVWSMMFDNSPLKTKCADKYAVREYVSEKIGEKYLARLFAVWDNVSEISFDDLPKSFFLKLNSGSARNMFVKDKGVLNMDETLETMRVWLRFKYWKYGFEMQYRGIQNKIIAEEVLDIDSGAEFKCWCFHGRLEFIKLEILNEATANGHTDDMQGKYFSRDWEPMPFRTIGSEIPGDVPKPENLDELVRLAETLSADFDFVRVDFYRLKDGSWKFGEMTFSPAVGNIKFNPSTADLECGDLLKLPKRGLDGMAVDRTQ